MVHITDTVEQQGIFQLLYGMFLFCSLWVPVFYLFRRSIAGESGTGAVWALLLGSLLAIFQFFFGNLIDPGGFGINRWIGGFLDVVALPVLIPIIVYSLFILFRVFSGNADFTVFTLLWLIPSAALRALSWSSMRSPILLVLVPVLWTALATGIPFFINCIIKMPRWYVIISFGLFILVLPVAAVTSYWAFFCHQTLYGFIFFFVTMLPMVISVTVDYVRAK